MDSPLEIVPFRLRRYESVPIDKIKVINSRSRDQEQFDMNTQSIDKVGLLKPVRVNDRFLDKTGFYELICGEGRLTAHQRLGQKTISAEVVTCSRKEAYLQSLIENIARTKPGSMDFAREIKRLYDEGWNYEQLARITCKSEYYIRDYIRLVEQGEERLIHGVEQGIFPIKFAIQVATTDDSRIQNVLMDAFDEGLVTTNNFGLARKLISARARDPKTKNSPKYTVSQLRSDIQDATRSKTSYIREAKTKENRFMALLTGINTLWNDGALVAILREEKLLGRPDLAGDFRYERKLGDNT
jgi:ParB family transcriptional regulator, chromosome partitioning protein